MIALVNFLSSLDGADLSSDRAQAWLLDEVRGLLGASSAALYLLDPVDESGMIKKTKAEGDSLTPQKAAPDEAARVRLALAGDSALDPEDRTVWMPLAAGETSAGAIRLEWEPGIALDPTLAGLVTPLGDFIARAFIGVDKVSRLNRAVAELRASRLQLLHSRNTLRSLFDSSPTSIYIIDRDYALTAVNMSRSRLAGQTPQELVGKRCYTALFRRDLPCQGCRVGETIAEGAFTRRIEQRQLNDRESADLEISAYPIYGEAGRVDQAFLFEEDVTERRQLEASLLQAEKLAAVGQLAAGVAHEINNPLTAILANAELLLRAIPSEDREWREMVGTILQAGERATQSVRDLLDFSRREKDGLASTDVNETILRTLSLIQHELLARSIKLTFDPEEGLPPAAGRRDQLQSVWLNLIVNAKQAIEPNPGEIRITTRRARNAVQVTVADSGAGIEPEQLERVFEPFYTTKDPGRGTGLGLSICHRIVTGHGGDIRVSSRPGQGTTFTVTLPLFEG